MAYASQQDMIDRYGAEDLVRLTDRSGTLDTIDAAVLDVHLEDATAEINGYLAKRFSLPFAATPRVLITHCCAIAYYRLLGTQAGEMEVATRLYRASVAFLERLERGMASLGDEDPADSQAATPGPVVEEGPGRIFTRDTLRSH